MSPLPTIDVVRSGTRIASLLIDGFEVHGIVRMMTTMDSHDVPRIFLEIISTDIVIRDEASGGKAPYTSMRGPKKVEAYPDPGRQLSAFLRAGENDPSL